MIVEGLPPSRKSRIRVTSSSFGMPASTGEPRSAWPLVPWQLAQVAARLRAFTCLSAAAASGAGVARANRTNRAAAPPICLFMLHPSSSVVGLRGRAACRRPPCRTGVRRHGSRINDRGRSRRSRRPAVESGIAAADRLGDAGGLLAALELDPYDRRDL